MVAREEEDGGDPCGSAVGGGSGDRFHDLELEYTHAPLLCLPPTRDTIRAWLNTSPLASSTNLSLSIRLRLHKIQSLSLNLIFRLTQKVLDDCLTQNLGLNLENLVREVDERGK